MSVRQRMRAASTDVVEAAGAARIEVVPVALFRDGRILRPWELPSPDWSRLEASGEH